MPALDAPPLRGDDAKANADEVRMRRALENLGTRSTAPVRSRPGAAAGAVHAGPKRRHQFARDGQVPVERVPPPVRSPGDLQRELTEERATRQRAEQALAEAQATINMLRTSLPRSEKAERAARETVEEREAAMVGLRAELQRVKAELKAVADEKAAAGGRARASWGMTAKAKGQQAPRASAVTDPQPARWWLPLL